MSLKLFRDAVNGGQTGIYANLTADIALDSTSWTPIGTEADPYVGTFNGGGHMITADEITADAKNRGLFGAIGNGGTIQALTVSINRLTVTVNAAQSGVIAAQNSGTIELCSVQINTRITVRSNFGLIVYQNSGTVENCRTAVNKDFTFLSESTKAAGIAYVNGGTIKNCFFKGRFRWRDYALDYAITSTADSGTVTNCYFFNPILGTVYYLDEVCNGINGANLQMLYSGEIAWKLNGSDNDKTDPWRQETPDGFPTLDGAAARVIKNSDNTYTLKISHTHRVDGNFCEFEVLDADSLAGCGNYYLDSDTVLGGTWNITGNTVLCLNGKTLATAENANIAVQNGGMLTLILHDNNTSDSKITGNGGSCITVSGGTLIMQDGNITCTDGTGVKLESGSFAMQCGEISGCATGVSVTGGTLTLSGNAKVTENILLAENQKIFFGELSADAKFGISAAAQNSLGNNDRITVTDTNGGQYFGQLAADGFNEDGTGFELYIGGDGETVALGRQSVHTHCICGTEYTNSGHSQHENITFKPWPATDSLPQEGNYYLTRSVTLNDAGQDNNLIDANICLNGYTVTISNSAYIGTDADHKGSLTDCTGRGTVTGGYINVSYGGMFSLFGGTLNGTYVSISQSGGTFNMYGGKITGNDTTAAAASGQNSDKININLYGGEISGNRSTSENGGGVYVGQGNKFNMYGGSIAGNSAKNGGGVYIASADTYPAGTFTMSGGAINGNTATENGAGVYVDGAFNISDSAGIGGNTVNGSPNNVYLPDGKIITITGELFVTDSIGVTTATAPADGKSVKIAVGGNDYTVKESDQNFFTSDAGGTYISVYSDGALYLAAKPHKHPVIPDGNGENVTWQPVDGEEALRAINKYGQRTNLLLSDGRCQADGRDMDACGRHGAGSRRSQHYCRRCV